MPINRLFCGPAVLFTTQHIAKILQLIHVKSAQDPGEMGKKAAVTGAALANKLSTVHVKIRQQIWPH